MSPYQTWLAKWGLDLLQLALLLPLIVFSFLRTRDNTARVRPFAPWFRRLARRKSLSVILVGLLSLGMRTALIPVVGIPQPEAHDEFSYLLAADTFGHARLTNPPHPMWVHFETFHVIQHPTYMSMYPPAQSVVLAFGEVMGNPWLGQLLITALMCSALCWMLQGWLPPEWALLGGLLAVLRLGIFGYWINGYWCASVAALGGALLIGALPRLKRNARLRDSLWIAVGLAILANSRPFEGLVLALTVAAALLRWLLGGKGPLTPVLLRRVFVPLIIVLTVAGSATGYYYYRVTGSPFKMAYQVNRAMYSRAPYFIWQSAKPEPHYDHAIMKRFYEAEFQQYASERSLHGFLRYSLKRVETAWEFYLGPILTLPLLMFPSLVRDRRVRWPIAASAVMVVAVAAETFYFNHYLSPAVGLLYIIVMQGMRHLSLWQWRGKRVGVELMRAVPLACCAMIVLRVGAVLAHAQIEPIYPRGNLERAQIERQLEAMQGKQLVLVHYQPQHEPQKEWVYNLSDIDKQKVVWARDMGDAANQELLHYYAQRHAWLLDADASPPEPLPYSSAWSRSHVHTP